MSAHPWWPKLAIIAVFLLPTLYVHFRGRVRNKFHRQIADHSTFLAPYNVLVYLFSAVPRTPILDAATLPELSRLRDNWESIRDEGLRLLNSGDIKGAVKHNDAGFNSFFKQGWKRFYIKWYDEILPSAQTLCPQTVALLQSLARVRAAMFVVLPAGSRLNPHRDPFAGSLRYHLGLATPNSDACHLLVDGEAYSWRDGQDVLFDETYIHSAENQTAQDRLILFCDVDRPLKGELMQWLNRKVSTLLGKATSTQNVEGERVGAINRMYAVIHELGEAQKRLKRANKTSYRFIKYALIGIAFYALIYF